MAAIRPALTDLDVKNFKLRTEVNDNVQDLGKDQGIDDMTGNLNDAPRHTNLSFPSILIVVDFTHKMFFWLVWPRSSLVCFQSPATRSESPCAHLHRSGSDSAWPSRVTVRHQ